MIFSQIFSPNSYDVVICGGGLAGQTLARQLKLNFPDISLLIIDKNTFPLPEAACKVGESTVEIAAYYFTEVLQLQDYFKNDHLTKLGLRYFFGDSQKCISDRPELGLTKFSPFDSYQIDRGIFENDLCRMNKKGGVNVIDNSSVIDITINSGESLHEVKFKNLKDESVETVNCRWVIDAMSRRSFLQKKFDLKIEVEENCSAAWFRVEGRFDYGDIVPESNITWHNRVPNRIRFYSTTHMMGKGYWVWIIPLSSGNTSIGVVTSEKIHPVITYGTKEKVMKWLEKNEPYIHAHLLNFKFLDFLSIKNYASSSNQIFSVDRWACIGDAAVFSDPFYSPGSNTIGFANSCVTKMIEKDINNKLTPETITNFNNFVISYNDWLIKTIHPAYTYFGNALVMSLNYLWDVTVGWSLIAPQIFNSIFLDEKKSATIKNITAKAFPITIRIKQLFLKWEEISKGSFTFEFIDYLAVPFIKEVYDRNLKNNKSLNELIDDHIKNVEILEIFAQVIFLIAVEDTMPEKASLFENYRWLNAQSITLNEEKWEEEGLFLPKTEPKDISSINKQIRSLYSTLKNNTKKEKVLEQFNFNF